MPDVIRLVHSLAHGAQQHGLNQMCVIALGNSPEQGLIIFGRGFFATAEREPQAAEKRSQVFEFFFTGAFVYAKQGGHFLFFEQGGGTGIGSQHAFFYQFVRFIAHHGNNALNFFISTEQDARFLGVKIHRAAYIARSMQGFI